MLDRERCELPTCALKESLLLGRVVAIPLHVPPDLGELPGSGEGAAEESKRARDPLSLGVMFKGVHPLLLPRSGKA